jgi:hypothetical protein
MENSEIKKRYQRDVTVPGHHHVSATVAVSEKKSPFGGLTDENSAL